MGCRLLAGVVRFPLRKSLLETVVLAWAWVGEYASGASRSTRLHHGEQSPRTSQNARIAERKHTQNRCQSRYALRNRRHAPALRLPPIRQGENGGSDTRRSVSILQARLPRGMPQDFLSSFPTRRKARTGIFLANLLCYEIVPFHVPILLLCSLAMEKRSRQSCWKKHEVDRAVSES